MGKKQTYRSSNISSIYISTSLAMMITELAGVLTALIDGIISGRFLDIYIFSGISLLKPLFRVVSFVGSFLAAGCSIVCSKLVGSGKKQDAIRVFNLCIISGILLSVILTSLCVFSSLIFRLCGVPASAWS